jgi:hypothetical protein
MNGARQLRQRAARDSAAKRSGADGGAARAGSLEMPQTLSVGHRSFFVTATAWVFIVLAGLASASALVQNAAVASLLPGLQPVHGSSLPLLTGFLVGYLPWIVGAGLVISLATLASAVGLLLRLDWARRVFIALLCVAIVANLLGLWLQQEVVGSVVSSTLATTPLPSEVLGIFGSFVTATRVMAVLVTLGACTMLAWIIGRLMSASVRQEFA